VLAYLAESCMVKLKPLPAIKGLNRYFPPLAVDPPYQQPSGPSPMEHTRHQVIPLGHHSPPKPFSNLTSGPLLNRCFPRWQWTPRISSLPGQDVLRPLSRPLSPPGNHIIVLKGNVASESAVVKLSGKEIPIFRGPVVAFDTEEAAFEVGTHYLSYQFHCYHHHHHHNDQHHLSAPTDSPHGRAGIIIIFVTHCHHDPIISLFIIVIIIMTMGRAS
jgi:hypothetical protein